MTDKGFIPGLKPLSLKNHLSVLPHRFHLSLPNDLVDEVLKCNNNKDAREVGIQWSLQQTKELIDFGVPCIHFYTMGKSDNIQKIVGSFA